MSKRIQARNWDGSKITVQMKHLNEWARWDMCNRKNNIHPTQSEFTEADFLSGEEK